LKRNILTQAQFCTYFGVDFGSLYYDFWKFLQLCLQVSTIRTFPISALNSSNGHFQLWYLVLPQVWSSVSLCVGIPECSWVIITVGSNLYTFVLGMSYWFKTNFSSKPFAQLGVVVPCFLFL
jgi:hypothetical protein